MIEVDFQVSGFKELDALLGQFPKEVGEKVLASATLAGATVIKNAIVAAAPMRHDNEAKRMKKGQAFPVRLPGNLKRSVAVRRDRFTNQSVKYVVGLFAKGFYGRFVEFGTRHAPAHPFARPAVDGAAETAIAKIRDALAQKIVAAAEKLAGTYHTKKSG